MFDYILQEAVSYFFVSKIPYIREGKKGGGGYRSGQYIWLSTISKRRYYLDTSYYKFIHVSRDV